MKILNNKHPVQRLLESEISISEYSVCKFFRMAGVENIGLSMVTFNIGKGKGTSDEQKKIIDTSVK